MEPEQDYSKRTEEVNLTQLWQIVGHFDATDTSDFRLRCRTAAARFWQDYSCRNRAAKRPSEIETFVLKFEITPQSSSTSIAITGLT